MMPELPELALLHQTTAENDVHAHPTTDEDQSINHTALCWCLGVLFFTPELLSGATVWNQSKGLIFLFLAAGSQRSVESSSADSLSGSGFDN